jgi:hypothetical protein
LATDPFRRPFKKASPRWYQLAVVDEAADLALPLVAALHPLFDTYGHIIETFEHYKYHF